MSFESWKQFGRIREAVKKADPAAVVYERNEKMKALLSTGQEIDAEKFRTHTDDMIIFWIHFLGGVTNAKMF